jgi:hypothetical protein
MPELNLSTIINLPKKEIKTETRSFVVGQEEYEFTIRVDGKDNAQLFYTLQECFNKAMLLTGANQLLRDLQLYGEESDGYVCNLLPGEPLVIKSPAYLMHMLMMEAVCIKPKFDLDHWVSLAHKMDPQVLEELTEWAQERNGVGASLIRQIEKLKKSVPQEPPSASASSAPASKSSVNSRRKPSKAAR